MFHNRQIYKGRFGQIWRENMTEELIQWWKGLGEELETDIEAINES